MFVQIGFIYGSIVSLVRRYKHLDFIFIIYIWSKEYITNVKALHLNFVIKSLKICNLNIVSTFIVIYSFYLLIIVSDTYHSAIINNNE